MFYGTTGETSEKESPGAEGSLNSSRASVNFPEVKSKVGCTCIIVTVTAYYNYCFVVFFSKLLNSV